MQPGTIIGFSGRDFVSDFINVMSCGIPRWSISHVGIIANDGLLVESRSATGVIANHYSERLTENARIYAYEPSRPLYHDELIRLDSYLFDQLGKPYDLRGALRSSGLAYAALQRCLHPEDTHTLFCSELVASTLRELGILDINHSSWLSPNKLCRLATRRGFYRAPRRLK